MRSCSLFAVLLLCLSGAPAGAVESDFIVMVDISASMAPYFQEVITYFTSDLLRDLLEYGDYFHFLSFNSYPEVEIVELISDETSIDRIETKIRLLQPIGLYTDLVAAVEFLNDYASTLPTEKPKWVMLLSDGIHDPPPGASEALDADEVRDRLLGQARILKQKGWNVHILQMPAGADRGRPGEAPVSGSDKETATVKPVEAGSADPNKASTPGSTGMRVEKHAQAETDGQSGQQRTDYLKKMADVLDVPVIPFGDEKAVSKNGGDSMQGTAGTRPRDELASQAHTRLRDQPDGAGQTTRAGDNAIPAPPGVRPNFSQWARDYGLYVLIAGAVVLAALASFLLRNRLSLAWLQQLFNEPKFRFERGKIFSCRGELIEMTVELQRRHVGLRNVHCLNPGTRRSIGGGASNFLIFLVPVPVRIADVSYDGQSLTFTPRRPELFPQLMAPVTDCLDANIAVRTASGYDLVMRFQRYISPLEQINKILLSPYQSAASRYSGSH